MLKIDGLKKRAIQVFIRWVVEKKTWQIHMLTYILYFSLDSKSPLVVDTILQLWQAGLKCVEERSDVGRGLVLRHIFMIWSRFFKALIDLLLIYLAVQFPFLLTFAKCFVHTRAQTHTHTYVHMHTPYTLVSLWIPFLLDCLD